MCYVNYTSSYHQVKRSDLRFGKADIVESIEVFGDMAFDGVGVPEFPRWLFNGVTLQVSAVFLRDSLKVLALLEVILAWLELLESSLYVVSGLIAMEVLLLSLAVDFGRFRGLWCKEERMDAEVKL